MNSLLSKLPWTAIIDGNDLVVHSITATCFGGAFDKGDNGQTESGDENDGNSTTSYLVALPIRSIESATANSPLAFKGPHIPWNTQVNVWIESKGEQTALACKLADNGPDISKYPDHAIDLNPNVVLYFDPNQDIMQVANTWKMAGFSYRIIGGAGFIS